MIQSAEQRAKLRYSYNTDPELGQRMDLEAIKLATEFPANAVGLELAMYGYVLLVKSEDEKISVIDPDSYNLELKI